MQTRFQGTLTVLALAAVLLPVQAQAVPPGRLLKTGQKKCWDTAGTKVSCAGTGQDGELREGLRPAYTDNGDGTITDNKTGLMWEKLDDSGTIHDKDNTYSWANAFAKVADLNTAVFAGHTDWRLPNQFELHSFANLQASNPAVSSAFNDACTTSCTTVTCSCTLPSDYWSSSTYEPFPGDAWLVSFFDGSVFADGKDAIKDVRAVRGGS